MVQLVCGAHIKELVLEKNEMSAYVRELLIDLVGGISNCQDTKIDLQQALQRCLDKGIITQQHINVLNAYLEGYSLQEMKPGSNSKLIQVLAALEQESRYTDDIFLDQMLVKYPKYRKIKMPLRTRLVKDSLDFDRRRYDLDN